MNGDILFFFDEHADALPLYAYLEDQLLTRVPDARIKVARTQISFSTKFGFAFVSFMPCRRAALRPKTWLTISFGLPYRRASERVDAAVEPYPDRWTHHVMIGSIDEIDGELLAWLEEAAAFSRRKR